MSQPPTLAHHFYHGYWLTSKFQHNNAQKYPVENILKALFKINIHQRCAGAGAESGVDIFDKNRSRSR